VTEVGRPANELMFKVYWKENDNIIQMRYSALDLVDVIRDKDITLLDSAFPAIQKLGDEAPWES
jgi:hypothetical protein